MDGGKAICHTRGSKEPCRTPGAHLGAGLPSAADRRLVSDPLERRGFVAKALNVDSVLSSDELEVLVRDAELLGVSQERDPVLRVLGKLSEVSEKSGPLDCKHRVGCADRHEDA